TLVLNGASLPFRSTTLATGSPVWALPAGGLAITIPLNATLGTSSSNVPFRIWIFVAYNSGTPVLGVATCSSSTAIFACAEWENIQKSGTGITAAATALGTLYTSAAVTNDAVRIIGYAEYGSGLATAGTWASGPTTLQLCLPPLMCKRPGDVVQVARTQTGASTTGATVVPFDDTIPHNTEGDQYMPQAITPVSTANLIHIESRLLIACAGGGQNSAALFQDGTASALAAANSTAGANNVGSVLIDYLMLSSTISATTFKIRGGSNSAGTNTFNGAAGTRAYGGVMNSFLNLTEI